MGADKRRGAIGSTDNTCWNYLLYIINVLVGMICLFLSRALYYSYLLVGTLWMIDISAAALLAATKCNRVVSSYADRILSFSI